MSGRGAWARERESEACGTNEGRDKVRRLQAMAMLSAVWLGAASSWGGPVRVAMLRDGDSPHFAQMAELLKAELGILAEGEWDLQFKEGAKYNADWDEKQAAKILKSALKDEAVDLVIADGLLVSRAAIRSEAPLNKPVVSVFVDDPDTLGLPISEAGTSTVKNYTFVVVPCDAAADVQLFHELVPFKSLAIVAESYYLDHLPELKARTAQYVQETGIRVELVPYGATAEETLAVLPADVEAVYLTPPVVIENAEMGKLIEGLNVRKLPSFSMMGLADVERGALAGQRSSDATRVVRRLALNIQQILLGAAPESLPVAVDDPLRTVVNARTARQLGVDLPYVHLLTAQVLHGDELDLGRPLTLAEAYRMALENHPGIEEGRQEVRKSDEDRIRARSSLFPQLSGNVQYAQIDEDRARASMGMQSWKSTTGGLELTQVIFNDPAIAGYRAYSRLYQSQQWEQESLELDTLADVAQAYINLLSKRALLKIDGDNYNLIQSNLDLARDRHRSGMAGPEEIYRWETQLASARSSLLESHAQVGIAQTILNQAMGTGMDGRWKPADGSELAEENPFLAPQFSDVIDSDRRFNGLRSYLLDYALKNSPELRALDFAIDAQGITLNQYRRSPYTPTLGVSLDYDRTFDQTMADSGDGASVQTGSSDADDDNWTAALVATWSLFEGGGKASDIRKAEAELARLRALREKTEQALVQRLYETLFSTSSSSPAIALNREAAELARKNLGVVQEKYARGAVSIVDLLDAQNEMFQQDQRAALAQYEFMLDVIQAQRAVGWMPELKSAEERAAWLAELDRVLHNPPEATP